MTIQPNTDYTITQSAVILLAAGASRRLGSPKQLLRYRGKSLLKHCLSAIQESALAPVVIVLGSEAELLGNEIEKGEMLVVYNNEWDEGIASSIRCGISALQQIEPLPEAAIIMLCDQPQITGKLLADLLVTQQEHGTPMTASRYQGIAGTPALFHKSLYPELLRLKGDKGAAGILQQYPSRVATIPFPGGETDIDTPEDYKRLINE